MFLAERGMILPARNARARILGAAALAVVGALPGDTAWAQQQPAAKSESERLLNQKAMMLQAYIASPRVAEALHGGEAKNIEAVDRARADLAEGSEALQKGDLKRAEQSFDAGLRHVSSLVLQQGARAEEPAQKKGDFEARRRQIDSFIRSLETGGDATPHSPWLGRLAVARKGLEQADALYSQEKYAEANLQLVSIYEDVVVIVSEARRNQSIIYRLNFETPAAEYAYELQRNKSYEILVDVAMAEKKDPDKALLPYIRKLVDQSRGLVVEAEAQASGGDHVKAIKTVEEATSHLVRALRGAGVMVME